LCDGLDERLGINGLAERHRGTLTFGLSQQLRSLAGNHDDRHPWKQRLQRYDEL
jgi:hypothetical protein